MLSSLIPFVLKIAYIEHISELNVSQLYKFRTANSAYLTHNFLEFLRTIPTKNKRNA